MSLSPCRHTLIGGRANPRTGEQLTVGRCDRHSRRVDGVEVCYWGGAVQQHSGCPCATTDRYLVAAEGATARWRQSADVVIAPLQPAVGRAVRAAEARLAAFPGCSLVAVAVGELGTVLRTRDAEQVVLPHGTEHERVCGVCAYPWLAVGGRIAELLEPLSLDAAPPSRR
jgi:hypothetical protein